MKTIMVCVGGLWVGSYCRVFVTQIQDSFWDVLKLPQVKLAVVVIAERSRRLQIKDIKTMAVRPLTIMHQMARLETTSIILSLW